MNEELTLALDELRRRSTGKAWFIPVKLDECSIPDRDIGGGETLYDIQHIELYQGWSQGIAKLADTILSQVIVEKVETDQVAQAFSQAGLSQFSILNSKLQRLISQVDDNFAAMMQALQSEATEGPRLFSFAPVDHGNFNPNQWTRTKFHLTLWCEHSRLPLPILNVADNKMGIYEVELERGWFNRAVPFLKALIGTLSLVLPVASSAVKLTLDETAYKAFEEQLDFGNNIIDASLSGSEKVVDWLSGKDASALEHSVRAQGSTLREIHVLLKEKDPDFGGLIRVMNKRREFLWVHPQFAGEY